MTGPSTDAVTPAARASVPSARTGAGAIGLAALLLSLLYAIEVHAADTWWHLATGRWIWANQTIPTTDPFGFVTRGQPWIYVDWLPELVMYAAWKVGGFGGLVVLTMCCAGVLLAGVGASARAAGARPAACVAAMVGVAVLAQPRFAMLRPNLFGAVLLAWGAAMVLRWAAAPGAGAGAAGPPWRRQGPLLALPLLAAIWMPTHGSAVLALGLAGAAGAVALVGLVRHEPADPALRRERLAAAALVAALTAAAFLALPSGRHILEVLRQLDAGGNSLTMTVEWRRTDLSEPRTWVPLAWTCAGVAFAAIRWRSHLAAALIALGGLWLARGYERNLAEAVLMSAPAVALAIDAAAAAVARRAPAASRATTPALAALVVAAHIGAAGESALDTRFGFGADESRYPHDTLATLRTLPEGRTLNSFGIGGYLIWHEIPGGVFADGRTVAVYTDAIFDEHILPASRDAAGLDAVADRFDARYGLASFGSLQFRVLMTSPTWIPIHHGESTSLFVRRQHAETVVRSGRVLLNELRWDEEPGWSERWYRAVLASPQGRAGLVAALRASAAEAPANPVLQRTVSVLRILDPTVLAEAGL